ncbi:MAG: MarR family transcriptional regulator [Actinomycetota bacterium]|nr:MarR family transcriptional regulator [Actinomycetota bacterium]MDA8293135.1 MarR family transcriptional regulator [Actinomycetota bacterium]
MIEGVARTDAPETNDRAGAARRARRGDDRAAGAGAHSDHPRAALTEDRLVRLQRAVGRSARGLRHTAAGIDLTPTQVDVLATVARTGPVPLSELTATEQLHPSMLSRIAGRLEATGLVERRPDPADGRAAVLVVTAAGAALSAEVRRVRTEALRSALGQLDPGTRRVLAEAVPALEALADALQQGPS